MSLSLSLSFDVLIISATFCFRLAVVLHGQHVHAFAHRVYIRDAIISTATRICCVNIAAIDATTYPMYTMHVPSYNWSVCMCMYIHVYVV